jgi:ketosteroid isomerase-like protein
MFIRGPDLIWKRYAWLTPSASAATAEDEVLQVAKNFVKAFNTSDLELMSSLHWHSPKISTFTPSSTGAFLTQGWDMVEAVWRSNPGFPKGTWVITCHNPQVTLLRDDFAVITEYFIMTINPPASKEQSINQIRQTLVVQKISGQWLIVHEHASMFPTE